MIWLLDVLVGLAPFPWLAVPLDSLLPEEVELLWVGQILFPRDFRILREGRPQGSADRVIASPVPSPRQAVPPGFLLPEEVKLLRAGLLLLTDGHARVLSILKRVLGIPPSLLPRGLLISSHLDPSR